MDKLNLLSLHVPAIYGDEGLIAGGGGGGDAILFSSSPPKSSSSPPALSSISSSSCLPSPWESVLKSTEEAVGGRDHEGLVSGSAPLSPRVMDAGESREEVAALHPITLSIEEMENAPLSLLAPHPHLSSSASGNRSPDSPPRPSHCLAGQRTPPQEGSDDGFSPRARSGIPASSALMKKCGDDVSSSQGCFNLLGRSLSSVVDSRHPVLGEVEQQSPPPPSSHWFSSEHFVDPDKDNCDGGSSQDRIVVSSSCCDASLPPFAAVLSSDEQHEGPTGKEEEEVGGGRRNNAPHFNYRRRRCSHSDKKTLYGSRGWGTPWCCKPCWQ